MLSIIDQIAGKEEARALIKNANMASCGICSLCRTGSCSGGVLSLYAIHILTYSAGLSGCSIHTGQDQGQGQ